MAGSKAIKAKKRKKNTKQKPTRAEQSTKGKPATTTSGLVGNSLSGEQMEPTVRLRRVGPTVRLKRVAGQLQVTQHSPAGRLRVVQQNPARSKTDA